MFNGSPGGDLFSPPRFASVAKPIAVAVTIQRVGGEVVHRHGGRSDRVEEPRHAGGLVAIVGGVGGGVDHDHHQLVDRWLFTI